MRIGVFLQMLSYIQNQRKIFLHNKKHSWNSSRKYKSLLSLWNLLKGGYRGLKKLSKKEKLTKHLLFTLLYNLGQIVMNHQSQISNRWKTTSTLVLQSCLRGHVSNLLKPISPKLKNNISLTSTNTIRSTLLSWAILAWSSTERSNTNRLKNTRKEPYKRHRNITLDVTKENFISSTISSAFFNKLPKRKKPMPFTTQL